MSRRPDISICVPTLRGGERLVRLRESLERHTSHVDWELIAVDCGGCVRGYTAPQNQALRAARADVLVAMNDDVQVTDGWVDPLLEEAVSGTWVCTPDQAHTDGPQVFAPYCAVWRRDAYESLGGYDEQFLLWCSDIDLARRLEAAGHLPVKVRLPVPVIHELNATTSDPALQAELSSMVAGDLRRYTAKWGTTAEEDKARLAAVTSGNTPTTTPV